MPSFGHSDREPVVLVQANACGEREIGTHAHEHAAPMWIVYVEVKLVHPALFVLQMGAIVVLVSHGDQDAGWFTCFQDGHHLVGFGIVEVCVQKLVSPALVIVAN